MATNFRPVLETWGTSSASFISPSAVEQVLRDLVVFSFAGECTASEYDETRSLWIEEGQQFLDYLEAKSVEFIMQQNSDYEFLNSDDLIALFTNMKNFVPEWRKLIKDDGSLTFYIDQY